MLRIVGIERSNDPLGEFVLLQNQGHMRLSVRGHILLADGAIHGAPVGDSAAVLADDEMIAPGLFVLVSSGVGEPHWAKTRDGAYVFHTFLNRREPIWVGCQGPLHVLAIQHSFVDRSNRIEYLVGQA